MKVNLPIFVEKILDKFLKAGYEIYIVGGAVRDILMKKEIHDWDFTTNAMPKIILGLFPNGFYDNLFGTVGIINPKDEKRKNQASKSLFTKSLLLEKKRDTPMLAIQTKFLGEKPLKKI